jgi:hypothetical protein
MEDHHRIRLTTHIKQHLPPSPRPWQHRRGFSFPLSKGNPMSDLGDIDSGLGDLRERVGNLERGLADNTAATKRIEANTAELVDVFVSWKGAMKVLETIGKAAKPLAAIVSLGAAVVVWWASIRGYFK